MGGGSELKDVEKSRIAQQFQDLARAANGTPSFDQIIQGWSLLLERSLAGHLKSDPHLTSIIAFLKGRTNFLDFNDASLGNFSLTLATRNDGWFVNGLSGEDRKLVEQFAEAMKNAADLHTGEVRDATKTRMAQSV